MMRHPLVVTPAMAVVTALNNFGLELLKALCAENPGGNVVLSPISLKACLSMVASGATDGSASQREMDKILGGIEPINVDKAVESFNSAWVRSNIKDDYLQHVSKTYGAEAFPLPQPDPADINAWVKRKTNGRIEKLFEELHPLTVLVLANAVLFKGSWATQFDSKMTQEADFTDASGRKLRCRMMRRKDEDMHYAQTELADMVRLPYVGGLSATILLPTKAGGDAMASLLASLSAEMWENLYKASSTKRKVELSLPRFKLEFGTDLSEPLQALGMPTPFRGEDEGAFLRMTDDPLVHLGAVAHQATIEVNEEGTVASAATGAVMKTRCMPPPVPQVTVDRPFVFLIADGAGALVFAAMVASPILS